ncbi:MAG: prepilin-type N-terminal cleavage/methylation domain-containing protein [Phycisphaerales bacterium]
MKRSKGFTLIELLVVISIIALLIGILLPALGAARRAARQMKNTTQVRGIVQGLVVYAGGNKERMPGTDSKGFIAYDLDGPNKSDLATTINGATVAGRYWLMLDNNQFTGEYLISPSETKTVWTTDNPTDISTNNYSFALLNITDTATVPTAVGQQVRPNQTGRAREWKQSINTQAILIGDRGRLTTGSAANDHDKIYSIHTSEDDEKWAGSVGRGDGSASFENESALDTKYGSGENIEADRIFTKADAGGTEFDVTSNTANWGAAGELNNCVLGYNGVGYEDTAQPGTANAVLSSNTPAA